MGLDMAQAAHVSKILEHLHHTDAVGDHEVVVFEGGVGLQTGAGDFLGTAVWNSDMEEWLFEAPPGQL